MFRPKNIKLSFVLSQGGPKREIVTSYDMFVLKVPVTFTLMSQIRTGSCTTRTSYVTIPVIGPFPAG